MFKQFLTALLFETLSYLGKHPDFFNESKEKKTAHLEALRIPSAFKNYLVGVESKDFLSDLALTVQYMNGVDLKSLKVSKSDFFKAMAEFLTVNLAAKMDELTVDFYMKPVKKQVEELDEKVKSDSHVARALKDILLNNSVQELSTIIDEFTRTVSGAKFIVLQSPREIEAELKKEIRKKLWEEYPYSFPIFQINRSLIGGLRVFIDGKTVDNSWFSRIVRITSMAS
jgi:F0F1-type ATP synthase delta subunit